MQRLAERLVARLLFRANLLPQPGHFRGQPLVVLLRRGDGGDVLALILLQLIQLGLNAGVPFGQRDALRFQLADLLLGRFDLGFQLLFPAQLFCALSCSFSVFAACNLFCRPFGPSMTSRQFLCVA